MHADYENIMYPNTYSKHKMKTCTQADFCIHGKEYCDEDGDLYEFFELWEGFDVICADRDSIEKGGLM